MLTVVATPGHLAAVIGHEVGHVLARHANERATQELAVQDGIALVNLLYQSNEGGKHEALRNAPGLGATYGGAHRAAGNATRIGSGHAITPHTKRVRWA